MRSANIVIIALGLIAAGAAQADLRVFACEPEWAALATEIGGDHVSATSAINGQQDPHYIQARPGLIAGVRRADLMVCSGADLEIGWSPLLQRQGGNPKVQTGAPGYFDASKFVEMREVPQRIDRAEGDIHPYGNPHFQLDPRNIGKIAEALAARLEKLDPENAGYYQQRQADFAKRWDTAIARWAAQAKPLAGEKIVTHHKSWVYLNEWLGLVELGNLEPKPGIPPSAAHLSALLSSLKGEHVTAIVRSSYQSARASEWLASRTGAKAVVLPQTVGAVDGADNLFAMFDVIIKRLLEASQ